MSSPASRSAARRLPWPRSVTDVHASDAKAAVRSCIDVLGKELVALSHRIHANPELSFQEELASQWVAAVLADGGLEVERRLCDLPTALVATAGRGALTIAICAEYDALPGIGHACGHNVIAAAAVGAGLALAPLVDELGITVKVFGTPAEESGAGKILMLERGAFAGVHAAMMVHPAPVESELIPCLALSQLVVRYSGREAHGSGFPEDGINAADALTVAQTAIGLLRQHIGPDARIHGIVTDGGAASNIVPAHTSGMWFVRESTLARLHELEQKLRRCFEAGALGTGCAVTIERTEPPCSEFRTDTEIAAVYRRNAEALGRRFPDLTGLPRVPASTDMANLSLAVPAIHPLLGLDSASVGNHQPEFAALCASPIADQAVLDGAVAMASTIIDLALDAALRDRLLRSRPVAGVEAEAHSGGTASTSSAWADLPIRPSTS